jgi:ribosome-binding protein aMBF1 (putative translation factor)
LNSRASSNSPACKTMAIYNDVEVINMTIGQTIRCERINKNLTITQLSGLLDISVTELVNIELDNIQPSEEVRHKLFERVGIVLKGDR